MNATLEAPVALTKSAIGKPPKRKILLVDDDPALCQMLRRLLAEEDFLVLTASNSAEVLELVKMTRFHLVLLDLKTPLEDEWETLGRLAAENPLLPVILITDRTDQFFHMLASGGALLERPLNPNKLFHTIHQLVAEPAERRLTPFSERPALFHYIPLGKNAPQKAGRAN
jgi:DNA-binding response OmpR family regulator